MQRAEPRAQGLCKEASKWRALSLAEALSALEAGALPHPSLEEFAFLLSRCRKERDPVQALRMHSHMIHRGLHVHPSLGNLLVSLLAHVGHTPLAHRIFDSLAHPDQWSWHSLITAFVKSGHSHHALSLYHKMQKDDSVCPTTHTFVALLKACAKVNDLVTGLLLHANIARTSPQGLEPFVGNALLCMYTKRGLLAKASQVFNDLNVRDVVSWTAIIGGYVEHGHGEEALEYFKQMQLEGVLPNAITFVCSLKACGSVGAKERGKGIHAEIERIGLLENNHFVGNMLVDMYMKWRSLVAAQEVFDKLPAPDAVTWNSLITGYAKQGYNMKALNCFERMQADGIAPNSVTFICILKVCGNLRAADKGQEIHTQFERKGILINDPVVGSTLVDMYVKCGLLAKALDVFDKIQSRDLISWTALIAGFAEQEHGEEALKHFEHMQLEGFSPDAPTLLCTLKACGIARALDKAEELHTEIERNGLFGRDLCIGSTLVDTYAKCGSLVKAQEVFDKLPGRDAVMWNVLITGYADHGHGEEVLRRFDQMHFEGVRPNEATFIQSLKACGSIGDIHKGEEILEEIKQKGLLEEDIVIGSTLVEMYANCGLLFKAQEVFEKLLVRDVVAWNTLIAGFVKHGHGEEALKCFDLMKLEGVCPDVVSYVSGLSASGSIRAIGKGQEMHVEIKKKGMLQRDPAVGNALVDMYVDCGSITQAQQVFNGLPVHDLVSWNSLIAGYTEHGHADEALKCFEQMHQEGISPTTGTFAGVLKACDSKKGQEIHAEIERKGLFTGNPFIGSALVNMYGKCGLLATAQGVFDELPGRDTVSWNALIAGYVEHGHGEEALKSFDQMQFEGVSATAVTYVWSLKACGDVGAIEKGQEIHVQIARKGISERNLVVGNTLIDMYAKCGFLCLAQQVFDKLLVRDIVSWSSLIAGFAQIGECEKVLSIFDRLRGEGVKPDAVTFVIVLNACSRKGFYDKCETYFKAMVKESGIFPALEHHSCMVDLLSRAGLLENALATIKKMPYGPNLVVWLTVLGACRNWGNVELGKQVFEHAVCLDDKDGAAYVLMSHIYANAGMQEEANKVDAMRQEKQTRTPLAG